MSDSAAEKITRLVRSEVGIHINRRQDLEERTKIISAKQHELNKLIEERDRIQEVDDAEFEALMTLLEHSSIVIPMRGDVSVQFMYDKLQIRVEKEKRNYANALCMKMIGRLKEALSGSDLDVSPTEGPG